MVLHPIIDLLKRIVIALPDYAGGGGELPEGMNHTGSGEILFASRTRVNTPIDHGLNFTPKLVIIWASNNSVSDGDMLLCTLERELFDVQGGTSKTMRGLIVFGGSFGGYDANFYSETRADFFITDTTFNIGHGSRFYTAGAPYYWFAFD